MSLNDETKVRALFILEILGRPPEYLTTTLEDIIKQLGEEKGVEIKEKKINEPVMMENQKDFYTSFAEIEIEVDEIFIITLLIFKYMPAHIEIISPEKISFAKNKWDSILNEITRRLHAYDEVARIIQTEKAILEKKLKDLMEKKKK